MSSKPTQVVLQLDLKYLTQDEVDWLHDLHKRIQQRVINEYRQERDH